VAVSKSLMTDTSYSSGSQPLAVGDPRNRDNQILAIYLGLKQGLEIIFVQGS